MSVRPVKACKYCGLNNHYPFRCRNNPKKPQPISRYGKVQKKFTDHRNYWIKRHGGEGATWVCYLQVSPQCPRELTIETLTLDHVEPRSRRPDLRNEDSNLKPACSFCNILKGSRNEAAVRKEYGRN